jgi:hypothetical protein
MAKTKISEFDSIAANNTDIDSINIAEGCSPSGINNAIRELMSQLKDQQTGAGSDNFTVGGNLVVNGTSVHTGATTFTGAVTFSSSVAMSTALPVASGGTGASTAGNARTNLSAASSGANSDITSITGLTTALTVAQGGTGVTTSTGTGSAVLSASPTFTGIPLAPTATVGTNTTQLATTAFVLANTTASPIPSGSVMLFYQSAAPTGWTQVTTLNDYDLRLVSGAGGTTGGTTAYSTVFENQTPSFTGSIGSLAGGATTLDITQIPSHTHGIPAIDESLPGGSNAVQGFNNGTIFTTYNTNATGGGGSHSHSISGTPSGTVGAVTLNVRYANIIICSKN